MKHVKAHNVLPKEVIELIQKYIDGEYVYIPRKSENEKAWGEKNGTRNSLKKRNNEIFKKYISGYKVALLAEEYFLSEQSIRRIISQEKKACS
ncbi:CD3324 family protein [Clostridium ihumii]|uniref:CD3324 family protein n=1 Tax=Clostridium ihumii TaxID=1470356 RepID=UPI00058AE82F|nr:CD3324 family protein [Clostridium ihumii]